MKKFLGFLTLCVVGNNLEGGPEIIPVVSEQVTNLCQNLQTQNNQALTSSDIQGIENILNAFVNMIKGVAHVMAHPESKLAAWTGVTDILTNTFKVITELAKHKQGIIDDLMICEYERRGPRTECIVESFEHELIVQEVVQTDPAKQVIASNVAHMIDNCANIIADPHNPHVVGSSVARILSGIINIALQLGKRGVTSYENECAALLADEHFMSNLSSVLHHKVARVHLLRLMIN